MKELTPEQMKFIENCRAATVRCAHQASEANRLGLPILAREWDYIGKCLEEKAGLQERAFRDGTLASPDAIEKAEAQS